MNNKQTISFSLDGGETFEFVEVDSVPYEVLEGENGIKYISYKTVEDNE